MRRPNNYNSFWRETGCRELWKGEGGLDFRPAFQNRGPRLAQGRCSGVKLSFSLPPAGTYNYSQGPHSETFPILQTLLLPTRSQRSTVPEVQEGLRLWHTRRLVYTAKCRVVVFNPVLWSQGNSDNPDVVPTEPIWLFVWHYLMLNIRIYAQGVLISP